MAVSTNRYTDIAEMLIERARDALDASLWVTDERGIVIASSDARSVGRAIATVSGSQGGVCVRVPFSVGSQSGEVVVGPPANDEALSPRLERVLVELMIQQALIVSQLPNRHELKNKFIHDLLRGQVRDETAILREGQILGLDLTHPRAVILIDASNYILGSDDSRIVEPSEVTDARAERRAQLVIATVVSFF
ncbi:MAG: CdaR family transcriptional regulator, partial [Ktedonobacterales bacterium]